MTKYHSNYGMMQHQEELIWLFEFLFKIKPKVIVEIGSWRGASLKMWDYFTQDQKIEDGLIISIDISKQFNWDINELKTESDFIQGNSTLEGTVNKLKEVLENRKIDFLFIDGDHHFNAVKKDYELYSPLVRSGGIIAFHDTNTEKNNVGRFFDGLQGEKYKKELCQGTGILIKE